MSYGLWGDPVEFKDFRFQIKGLTEQGAFSGYAAYKNNIDSYNDIILDGSFKRTIRNKKQFPILFMHDPTKPVGLSTLMKEDKNGLYTEGQLDLDTEMGRMVYSGLRKGYIDAMSIGFNIPKGGEEIDNRGRRLIKEVKLLEYSLITKGFQANELAMVSGFKSNHDLDRRIQVLEEKYQSPNEEGERELNIQPILDRIDDLQEEVKQLADSLVSTRPYQDSTGVTPEETKDVIGSSDLPLASSDREWSESEAEKRIWEWANGDISKVKRAYFWVDGDPENKSSYKLPFADVIDGKLVAVPNALSAVKGALNGARGGVKGIPDEDKKRIMSKVDAYQKKEKSHEPDEGFFLLLDEIKNFVEDVKK